MTTHNEALLEAYASCPSSSRIFYTLEIWQSSFAQAARVVANVGDDMVFGIEQGAPRDAGAMVSFLACPFQAAYPEQREGQPPSTKITIDNVSRELVPLIRTALGVRQYIDVLYREYLSSDLTEPAYGPVEFRIARGADDGDVAHWHGHGQESAEQAFPALDQKLRLRPVSEPVADMTRSESSASLIGEPWAWQSRNCWDFACHVAAGAVRPRAAACRRAVRSVKALDPERDRAASRARRLARGALWAVRPGGCRRRRAGADGASAISRAYRRLAQAGGARHPLQRTAWCLLRNASWPFVSRAGKG